MPDYLCAFDVGSLSQSVDPVGSFRYTTKLSEYLAVGLPVITGEAPVAYDLDEGYLWRVPGKRAVERDLSRRVDRVAGASQSRRSKRPARGRGLVSER